MSKKNTRKRLLAGALATVMMLTMCPSWALADDDYGIATLPAIENSMPVVDFAPAADPIETPDVPSSSETEAPAEDQNTAPAPSDDGANGGTDVAESGNSTNSTVSEDSENNSQNDNAADNAPENEIASQKGPGSRPVENSITEIDAEYWITNVMAKDSDDNWKLKINAQTDGIKADNGVAVEDLVPEIRENIGSYETTVFNDARVLGNGEHQELWGTKQSTSGTEIDRIRYSGNKLQYQAKDSSGWTNFKDNDQLVFYYLVRSDYSKMVQIDVSDWAYDDLDPDEVDDDYRNDSGHYSVTYQVIVEEADGTETLTDSRKFWYNTPLTVSLVAVREISSDYTIERIVLDPSSLGNVQQANGEYKFSLALAKAERDKATVKIYVKSKKQPHQLSYDENGGEIKSEDYTVGSVYPKQTITVPAVEKTDYTFAGWFDEETGTKYETGALMPDNDLVLTAHWTAKEKPTTKYPAKYFILLPNRGVPEDNSDQGQENYLPSSTQDGGVSGLTQATGYEGYLTAAGMAAVPNVYNSVTDITNGVNKDYLEVPSDLGFFTASNWGVNGYTPSTNVKDIEALLGKGFHGTGFEIVWYTIKNQSPASDEEYNIHVDGYLKGVDVNVTYHSNFGTDVTEARTAKTGEVYNAVSSYAELPKLPSRLNYEFTGWYTDKECKKPYSPTLLMNSMDLYAGWNQTAFDVSYFIDNKQDGETETYAVGADVTVKAAPTKEGHTFIGWTPASDIIKVVDGKFTMPAQNVRFDGTFKVNQYNVIYKVDNEVVGTDKYDFNSDVAVRGVPTKEGYTFSGWSSTDSAFNSNGFKMPAHDVVIEGEFAVNDYTVTYLVDGVKYDEKTYTYNSNVYLLKAPTAEGRTFSGWNVPENVPMFATGGGFKMPAHDVVITGTFNADTFTVAYYLDGVLYGQIESYKYGAPVTIRDDVQKDGWAFSGWTIDNKAAADFTMPAHNVEIHGSHSQNKHQYTVVKHFYDEKGAEIAALGSTETKTGAENALIEALYREDAANQTVDGKTYAYVSGLTTVTPAIEKLTQDVTVDLHYYLDVKGSASDPDNKGNGTPDAWEYRITFKVVNGEWNDGGNADIVVYVPFKDKNTGSELASVIVPITSVPAVGEKPNTGFHAGAWDKTPEGKVENDIVFTYTYEKDSTTDPGDNGGNTNPGDNGGNNGGGSSSGGHHRRNDTVIIPDEVPTGLNGDDHYAYIVGYPDSTVRPQNGITRAEVATIFFRLLTDETRDANSTKSNSYSDVDRNAWYNHAVSTLSAMGIVKGSNGKFNPNAPITRAEFAAIAARFDDDANTTAADFSDIASHWAKDEISAASNNGWIYGYTDGTFRPDNHITRAEAMTLVNRVLKRLPETEEDLHDDMIKWSDNSDASQWFYLAVQEATNSHYYETKENEFEKWSELRETRDWTELEK